MKTCEEFLMAEIREWLQGLVPAEQLDTALLGIKLSRSVGGYMEAIERACKKYDTYLDEKNRRLEPSIEYLMSCQPDGDGQAMYNRTQRWLAEYTNHSVMKYGYFTDTNQTSLQIHFLRKKPLSEQLHILEFAPHIKPLSDGFCLINILEPSLSAGGSYYIRFQQGGPAEVIRGYGIRYASVKHKSDNLLGCLEYVHEHLSWEEGD